MLAVLAACGGARAPANPAPKTTPFLMLFAQGRTWTLPIEAPGRGTVECTVAEVKQVGDANVSRLACARPHEGLLVVGTWVATPAGLYHPLLPIDDADELALLGDDDLLLTTIPSERTHDHALGDAADSIEAFTFRGSWCVRNTVSRGDDRRGYMLCFDGATVTGGSDLVVGDGAKQHLRFGAAPPDPEDDAP
jgi:hypothetical protein